MGHADIQTTMRYLHHKSRADDRDDHREMALDDRERIGHTLEGERNQQERNREARGVESEQQRAMVGIPGSRADLWFHSLGQRFGHVVFFLGQAGEGACERC